MKNNTKWALIVSLFVLIGFPIFFLLLSLITDQWKYLLFSIPPSLSAGLTGIMLTLRELKIERKSA
ncbi:hypothetical protein MHB48_15940 [Psychrobacillus sp. FSL H8-0483]|uniref:hypothetical protein n=1 Tax=Psychrobacillus sp. FSL H8-0483 TaxID=2921389 RepID=UPI00315AE1E1